MTTPRKPHKQHANNTLDYAIIYRRSLGIIMLCIHMIPKPPFKLDIAKTYYKVSKGFLLQYLQDLVLGHNFCNFVNALVDDISINIAFLILKRSIWQG